MVFLFYVIRSCIVLNVDVLSLFRKSEKTEYDKIGCFVGQQKQAKEAT